MRNLIETEDEQLEIIYSRHNSYVAIFDAVTNYYLICLVTGVDGNPLAYNVENQIGYWYIDTELFYLDALKLENQIISLFELWELSRKCGYNSAKLHIDYKLIN